MSEDLGVSTVLYPTDLGDQAKPVFKHALALAKQYDAKIIMLHVVEPMSDTAMAFISSYMSKNVTDKAQKATMQEILVNMKARLKQFYADESNEPKEDFSPVKEFLVVGGKPSEEILRVAEEDKADMIVMGKSTRKVRGIRVMGSTARRVSRMSDVPVLVVPNY